MRVISLIGTVVTSLVLSSCTAGPSGGPTPAAKAPAPARAGVIYFTGVGDTASRTLSFSLPSAVGSQKDNPEVVTVGYGGGADKVYLHTISVSYDDGTATVPPCGAMPGQFRLCASVAAVNGYPAAMNNVTSYIDSISSTGVTDNGPYSYGTVAANSTSSPLPWVFTLTDSTRFTFSGHVVGDVPWLPTGAMTHARRQHTTNLLASGKVLVTGGYSSVESRIVAASEIYDPTAGTWTSTGSLLTPRFAHASSVIAGGKVLVSGGVDGFGNEIVTSEIFDPATNLWTLTGPLNTARSNHTQTTLPSGKVLISGGQTAQGLGSHLASAEIFDPTTNLWTTTGSMSHLRTGHRATLVGTKVLVTGGAIGVTPEVCELFDPASGTWADTGSLSSQLTDAAATLLPSGKVLVTGGLSATGFVPGIQLYDPSSGTFTTLGALNTPRSLHTATLTAAGNVLVAGGYDGTGASSVTEECDPVAGTCTTSGALTTARESATGVQLTAGKTLVVGGYDTGSNSLATSEIYDN